MTAFRYRHSKFHWAFLRALRDPNKMELPMDELLNKVARKRILRTLKLQPKTREEILPAVKDLAGYGTADSLERLLTTMVDEKLLDGVFAEGTNGLHARHYSIPSKLRGGRP